MIKVKITLLLIIVVTVETVILVETVVTVVKGVIEVTLLVRHPLEFCRFLVNLL